MLKKIFILSTFLCFSIQLLCAQDVRLGGGISYGTVIKNAGINLRSDIRLNEQWAITPHFNWFFNKKKNLTTLKWKAINIDAHYTFDMDDSWTLYPLFGINIATVTEKVADFTFSNTDIGFNLGFGSEYKLDSRLSGIGEIKYVISDADQAEITIGILYQISAR